MNDFPDYEASRVVARRLLQEYVSFMAEMANPGNRYVTGEMVTKGNERILRLMDEVVDVALGDEPLYRSMTDDEYDLWRNHGATASVRHKNEYMVRVWPKEAADE